MRRSDNRAALTDEVARFQAEIQRLAFAAARAIVQSELDRRRAEKPAAPRTKPRAARRRAEPVQRAEARPELSTAQLMLGLGTPAEPSGSQAGAATAATVPQSSTDGAPGPADAAPPPAMDSSPEPATRGRKRVSWTREAIIKELASWMSSGTAIDATFVTRHGPPGLVAATRRVFGRFEAALNVAGLHVSKLYPDGPPGRQQ
jgi:hypothetical protein